MAQRRNPISLGIEAGFLFALVLVGITVYVASRHQNIPLASSQFEVVQGSDECTSTPNDRHLTLSVQDVRAYDVGYEVVDLLVTGDVNQDEGVWSNMSIGTSAEYTLRAGKPMVITYSFSDNQGAGACSIVIEHR